MANTVAWAALIMSLISFFVYLGFSLGWLGQEETKQAIQASEVAKNQVRGLTAPTPAQVADLLKALGSLTDSLVKAGPALWSLVGSVLFLLIAAIAAGAIGGGSPSRTGGDTNQANTSSNTAQEQGGTPPARPGAPSNENIPVGNGSN